MSAQSAIGGDPGEIINFAMLEPKLYDEMTANPYGLLIFVSCLGSQYRVGCYKNVIMP